MIRRFALWRAREDLMSAGLLEYDADAALLLESDVQEHDRCRREAEELRQRAAWWVRVADWRRELRALLFDDPEHDR